MPTHMKSLKCQGPDCMGCSSPDCYSKGGEVKGVHEPASKYISGNSLMDKGTSLAGAQRRIRNDDPAHSFVSEHEEKEKHRGVLSDLKSMKKPNLYAEGGAVHMEESEEPEMDGEGEDEIHGLLGEELMGAIERKDKKAIMQCIEACVMSCLSKEGEE